MAGVGTFPFGWIRGIDEENWQIIWDPKTESIFAKGALSGKVIEMGKSSTWEEAKVFADKIIDDPASFLSLQSETAG